MFLSSYFSKLDEDNLYMAYAGIMAKVQTFIVTTVTASVHTYDVAI